MNAELSFDRLVFEGVKDRDTIFNILKNLVLDHKIPVELCEIILSILSIDHGFKYLDELTSLIQDYNKKLSIKLKTSLGTTFYSEGFDSTQDIQNQFNQIQKKALTFKKDRILLNIEFIGSLKDLKIPHYTSKIVKILSYELDLWSYKNILLSIFFSNCIISLSFFIACVLDLFLLIVRSRSIH